jgi:hypothetical protein
MIINSIILTIFVVILLASIVLIDNLEVSIVICILSIIGIILGICNTDLNIPAIEVYRGNTTLQITYEGDTPIDSTVVWKKSN